MPCHPAEGLRLGPGHPVTINKDFPSFRRAAQGGWGKREEEEGVLLYSCSKKAGVGGGAGGQNTQKLRPRPDLEKKIQRLNEQRYLKGGIVGHNWGRYRL